jgi:hypothetical protein
LLEDWFSLNLYSDEVLDIASAYLLSRKCSLVYIDQAGYVRYVDLKDKDKQMHVVMADKAEPKCQFKSMSKAKFLEVCAPENEKVYVFRTDNDIEIYDMNFSILFTVPSPSTIQLKSFSDEQNYVYILAQTHTDLSCWRCVTDSEVTTITRRNEPALVVKGNPVLDVLHCAIDKFGVIRKAKPKLAVVIAASQEKTAQAQKYLESLKSVKEQMEFVHVGAVSSIPVECYELPLQDLSQVKWDLATRVPLHIASIQHGNLLPLYNGLNYSSKLSSDLCKAEDYFIASSKNISFGTYESLLKSAEDVRVVGIIGKQSVGKSFLLNQIFGTRFNVTNLRCTDGIWMSMAKLGDLSFVVLDSEGLLSTERTAQEEIKLCLALSAVCDILIFCIDIIGIDRSMKKLLKQFSHLKGRLNKNKNKQVNDLFRGKLLFTMRDVSSQEEAETQLNKTIVPMKDHKELEFMLDLFNGNYEYAFLPVISDKASFTRSIEGNFSNRFKNLSKNWQSGEEFMERFKIVLIQIFNDDNERVDQRTFPITANRAQELLQKLDLDSDIASSILKHIELDVEVVVGGVSHLVPIRNYLKFSLEETKTPVEALLGSALDSSLRDMHHNDWYMAFNKVVETYFQHRTQHCLDYLREQLGEEEEFAGRVRAEVQSAKSLLEKFAVEVVLCLCKCIQCDLKCTRKIYHTDECSCLTDHICKHSCQPCANKTQCFRLAAHEGVHLCQSKAHFCSKPCSVADCRQNCSKVLNHPETERCKCSLGGHKCRANCAMHEACHRKCRVDIETSHDQHYCGLNQCPFPCVLCSLPCASTDHFHNLKETRLYTPSPIFPLSRVKVHLCVNEHKCRQLCLQEGRCDTTYFSERRKAINKFNTIDYEYTTQAIKRHECSSTLTPDSLTHTLLHTCSLGDHKCTQVCPDCRAFCEFSWGHEGPHMTMSHRNKENCIYIAHSEVFENEFHNSVYKLEAGSKAVNEFCSISCAKSGRGHLHPIVCRGGDECLGLKLQGKAQHSQASFFPAGNYDLVRCDAYWSLHNWVSPLKIIDPDLQDEQIKCGFYCAHSAHGDTKVFCEALALHSTSPKFSQHNFSLCYHPFETLYQIVFVVDVTGSMSDFVLQVQHSVGEIINYQYPQDLQFHFAAIAFTDHDTPGSFTEDKPYAVYPQTRRFSDGHAEGVRLFLNSFNFKGGGSLPGEAVIDGLFQASELVCEPGSKRILFLLTDDKPHGDEFGLGSKYPRGCPCLRRGGHSWQSILSKLAESKFDIYNIKLNDRSNIAINLFSNFYGSAFHTVNLADSERSLTHSIATTVRQTVQRHMECSSY